METESFVLYSESKPPKNTYIYLLENGRIGIYYTGIYTDPNRYVAFNCFDCSFLVEQFNFNSPTLEWKKLSNNFVEPCVICKEKKLYHFCGKDSHPYCGLKISEIKEENRKKNDAILHEQMINRSVQRGKNIFNFIFIKLIVFIAIIILCMTFMGLGDFMYKKLFWFQVLDPAMHTTSNQICKIIETIKK